jgi:ligand-binding sensor domain-containing protein
MMLGAIRLAAQEPFLISTTPRTQNLTGASADFTVTVSAQLGFTASVMFSAYSPTLPGASFSFTPNLVNAPYTTPTKMTVTMTGPKTGGTHTIVIEARNGPAVARDSVTIVVTDKPAWRVYTTYNSPLPGNTITSIAIDRDGAGWVGTTSGLARLDASGWTVFNSSNGFPQFPHNPDSNMIDGIAIDSSNNVWVATGGGIVRYSGGQWSTMPGMGKHVIGDSPQKIACDHDGNIWVACDAALMKFSNGAWTALPTGTSIDRLASVVVDGSNTIWTGDIYGTGLARFDGTYWTYYTGNDIPLRNYRHRSLSVDRQGHVWFVDYTGVVKFDGTQKTAYESKGNTFPGPSPMSIDFDDNGNIWSGNGSGLHGPSLGGGLIRYEEATSTSWYYTIGNSGLPNDNINVVKASHDMSVWIGTVGGGLAVLDGGAPPATLLLGVDDAVTTASPGSSLRGVYPNPASTFATLDLMISKPGYHKVSIVDNLGREVAVPLQGRLEAGQRSVPVDLSGVAAGSYFVRISGKGVSETRGLVVRR